MSAPSVVIVEDDFLIAEHLKLICGDVGATVLDKLSSADGAAERILELAPDFALMDVRLGGKRDGVDVANAVHAANPDIRLVFITGSSEPPTVARIKEDHPFAILFKPISAADLKEALGM